MPFDTPNFTQIPNNLFEMMADMNASELKVVLAICRLTFGYHKDSADISLNKLAEMTGLSRNAVIQGAQAAEERQIIERVNDGLTTTSWKIVFASAKIALSYVKNCTSNSAKNALQLGLNKEIKLKESDDNNTEDTIKRPNIFVVYEQEIGPLTPTISHELMNATETYTEAWVADALKEASKSGVRNWNYAYSILKSWHAKGRKERKIVQPEQTETPEGGFYV